MVIIIYGSFREFLPLQNADTVPLKPLSNQKPHYNHSLCPLMHRVSFAADLVCKKQTLFCLKLLAEKKCKLG